MDELMRRALGAGVEAVVPLGGLVAERYEVAGTEEPGSTFLDWLEAAASADEAFAAARDRRSVTVRIRDIQCGCRKHGVLSTSTGWRSGKRAVATYQTRVHAFLRRPSRARTEAGSSDGASRPW